MSARLREQLRRQRDRRDARERAWREHVCRGPLVDAFRPVISGGSDEQHRRFVAATARDRALLVQSEANLLAVAFAKRCNLRLVKQMVMIEEYLQLIEHVGQPSIPAYNSTSPAVPTTGTHGGTIPAL